MDAPPVNTGFWPVLLCWLAVALEGFDLVVIGAVIPTLSKTGDLGFTDASLTTASTIGLVGVGIGAVCVGPLTDRFGRRMTLIGCIAMFSVLTLAVAFAQNVAQFTDPPVPGRPRARCLPAHRAGLHVRARPQGPRRHCGDADDDRLPRGRRAHRAAGAAADRALRLGVDVRRRRRRRPPELPVLWFKLPESETYLRAVAAREPG